MRLSLHVEPKRCYYKSYQVNRPYCLVPCRLWKPFCLPSQTVSFIPYYGNDVQLRRQNLKDKICRTQYIFDLKDANCPIKGFATNWLLQIASCERGLYLCFMDYTETSEALLSTPGGGGGGEGRGEQ